MDRNIFFVVIRQLSCRRIMNAGATTKPSDKCPSHRRSQPCQRGTTRHFVDERSLLLFVNSDVQTHRCEFFLARVGARDANTWYSCTNRSLKSLVLQQYYCSISTLKLRCSLCTSYHLLCQKSSQIPFARFPRTPSRPITRVQCLFHACFQTHAGIGTLLALEIRSLCARRSVGMD